MPVIKFESAKLPDDIKKKLLETLTNVSSEITGIPKDAFFVSLNELPDSNMSIGGITVEDLKKSRK